jgi:predicted dehydrogenase
MSLRWGILAAGGIARRFATDLQVNGMTVTAVGSRTPEKARAFAEALGIAKAHGSYAELAEDPDVDAIYVATPHPFHVTAGELAIRAGKHVLIEKPFTLNSREAQRLADLGREHGVVVMEAMWTRFLPHMVRLRALTAEGKLGVIRALVATHTQDLPDDPKHRLNDLALGGGALLDLGVYPVSFAFDILGEPSEIVARGRLRETGADAEFSAMLRYAGGTTAMLLATSDAGGPNRAQLSGTAGYVDIDGVWYAPTSFRLFDADKKLVEEYIPPEIRGRGMHFQALEVERLAAAGQLSSPLMPVEQSVGIMRIMDEIRAQIGVLYPNELGKL